jgi:hypothetical protein
MGLDATIPWVAADGHPSTAQERREFWRVGYEQVDLDSYLT